MVLTLERFTSIVYPIWHNNTVTRRKVAFVVLMVWLLPLGQCLLEATLTTVIVDGHCQPYSVWMSPAARKVYGVFILICYNILPLVCFVVCYAKMALVIREKARRMRPSNTADSLVTSQVTTTTSATLSSPVDPNAQEISNGSDCGNMVVSNTKNNNQVYVEKDSSHANPWSKAKRNILITLAWVCALYVICWTPQGVYFFIINMTGEIDFVSDFNNFAILMIYLNCCVNPFVYLAKYDLFRASARALFFTKGLPGQHVETPARNGGSDGTQ